jgi:hypothetical protein
MDEATSLYARHRKEATAWMLSRFVVPASRLHEFSASLSQAGGATEPWHLAVLAGSGDEARPFLESSRRDLERAADFERELGERYIIQSVEFRIPERLFESGTGSALTDFLDGLIAESGRTLFWTPLVFFEIPSAAKSRAATEAIMVRLAGLQEQNPDRKLAVKIRTGGLTPASFPSSEDVARFLDLARRHGLPLKATAGLHHPIRRYAAEVKSVMHGFLNFLTAGVLAHARALDASTLRSVLDTEDVSRFRFGDDGLTWREHRASQAEIETARQALMLGFGTCSYEEPRDDLRGLRLL